MSVNEILTSVNLIGGTDAITFEAFIIRKLVPKLWKGACVVMDPTFRTPTVTWGAGGL